MYIDLTIPISPAMEQEVGAAEPKVFSGHLGTHFDCMDGAFPLSDLLLNGLVVDVSGIAGRDIEPEDLPRACIKPGQFLLLHTGVSEKFPYGTKEYFAQKPQLSRACVDDLLNKGVALIGIDAMGIRHGADHVPTDQLCADRSVFVIENLTNLHLLLRGRAFAFCDVITAPMSFMRCSGIPCRVAAKLR